MLDLRGLWTVVLISQGQAPNTSVHTWMINWQKIHVLSDSLRRHFLSIYAWDMIWNDVKKSHLGRIHVVVDEGVNDGGKLGLDDEVTGGLKVRNESSQSFADLREITTELITRHHSTGSPPRWRQQSAARWCRWWWSRPGPAWCPCRCCRSTHSWAGPGQRRRGWERRGRGGPGSTSTVAERERGGMLTFIITRDTVTYYYKVEDKRDVAEF